MDTFGKYGVIYSIEKDNEFQKTNSELAKIALETFPDILNERNSNGVSLHIAALKRQMIELNIPDPVHNNDKGFNKY